MSGPRSLLRRTLPSSTRINRGIAGSIALLVLLASSVAAVPVIADHPSPEPTVDGGTSAAPVVQVTNTTAYLELPPDTVRTTGFATVQLDPAADAAITTARVHSQYETVRLRESFAAAGTEAAQRRVVRDAAQRLDARIDRLERRQTTALAAYNDGEISKQTLLRELVAVHAAAATMSSTIDQLYTFDRATGTPVSQSDIAALKTRLIPLHGPVRDRVATAVSTGNAPRVHLTTSGTGFVLTTVAQGELSTQYIREAYYGDGFDDQFTDRPIGIDTFEERVAQQYPWTWANNGGTNSLLTGEPQYLRAGIYGIAVNHPHGTIGDRDLVVFYDASTDEIFYEIQRKDVSAVPTDVVASSTSGQFRVEVKGTHTNGPLGVRVVNTTTNTAIDARVTLNGEEIGATGDGTLWTVAPRGPFTVIASTPDGNVTVSSNI